MIPDVPYRFTIRPLPADEGGGYLIEFPDLPGCMSDGPTEEAITNGIDAMRRWAEAMRAKGRPIPHRPAPLRHEPLADGTFCPQMPIPLRTPGAPTFFALADLSVRVRTRVSRACHARSCSGVWRGIS